MADPRSTAHRYAMILAAEPPPSGAELFVARLGFQAAVAAHFGLLVQPLAEWGWPRVAPLDVEP